MFKNFNKYQHISYAQVFELGEYYNDLRSGQWKIIHQNKKIGNGRYNEMGQKIGKWIELSDSFFDYSQVTYNGEYNIKGMKVGKWDIFYCQNLEKYYKQIGGGSYLQHQDGTSNKFRMWIELWEGFNDNTQVTYNGEYNMKGMKVGQWDIMYNQKYKKQYKKIGGGAYIEYQDYSSRKIGQWVELWEGFKSIAQVIYNGSYNFKGNKVARWNILNLDKFEYNNNSQIGGGYYEEQQDGASVKIGMWIELWEGFNDHAQVTYSGEYNSKGMKMGRWNIWHLEKYGDDTNNQIGGGQYEEQQDGISRKVGIWIELWEGFDDDAQVTYRGEYNIKGEQIGQWEIKYRKNENKPFKKIGGGQYYEEGGNSSIKIGRWIEMGDYWWQTYNGDYNKQGIKIGIWKVMDISQNNKFDEIIQ